MRVPFESIVLAGASNKRESCPGWVAITSRLANPQKVIVSPAPWTRATWVIRLTVALATSTVAMNCVPLVTVEVGLEQAAGSNCAQEMYKVPPAGTGCDPGVVGAQALAAEIGVVRQWMPSVESLRVTGPSTKEWE